MTMGANCDLLRSGCVSGEECTSISSTCQCTFGTGHACDANDDCASGDCATLSRTCECQYDSDCHGGSTCTHYTFAANTCEIDSGPSQCGTGYSCAGDGITSSNKCFNDAGRKQTPIKELPFANLVIQASGGSMPGNSVAGSPIIKAVLIWGVPCCVIRKHNTRSRLTLNSPHLTLSSAIYHHVLAACIHVSANHGK